MSNGNQLFLETIDGRTVIARRFRDIMAEVISDLGGDEGLSEGQRQLVRRVAALSVQCEVMELEMVQGRPIDVPAYGTLCNTLRRLLADLGLKRIAKDTTPTLNAYMRDKYSSQETEQ